MDPALRSGLIEIGDKLEALYRDTVDIEFTVDLGRLYMLQVRPAKRTAAAAVRVAADLVAEGVIEPRRPWTGSPLEQIRKLPPGRSTNRAVDRRQDVLAQGLGSSPGHAHGAADARFRSGGGAAPPEGGRRSLVRPTTSPKDIRGMLSANGIVTATGGA